MKKGDRVKVIGDNCDDDLYKQLGPYHYLKLGSIHTIVDIDSDGQVKLAYNGNDGFQYLNICDVELLADDKGVER